MPFRLKLIVLALALLISPASASAAGLPVVKKLLKVTTARIEVSIEYPQTHNPAIDAVLLAFVHRQVEADRGYGKDARAANGAFDFEITYTVERNDGKMFAVVFSESSFTGGAHPNDFSYAFNFLLPDGAQVFLPEIVDGARGIARIGQLAAADLMANIASGPEPASDAESIARGTRPFATNFKSFVWLPNKLRIYFSSYDVASYAAGPQEATIPLSRLKDVIRPDWRAPAPSFDCRKAAADIEKAICADAALARLDRQTAEAYQDKLRYAEPALQEKIRQAQRDWIAKRNRSCSGPAAGACLTNFYRDRLAVLERPEG